MSLGNDSSPMMPLPACARLAAVCAAIEGKDVTCPAAIRRTCPTLAAIRRAASVPPPAS
jgi:hypothetical protein